MSTSDSNNSVASGSAEETSPEAASAKDRNTLRRNAGRPSIDPDNAIGGPSPCRQTRLPRDLCNRLDGLADDDGRTPSELMREAIDLYVSARNQIADLCLASGGETVDLSVATGPLKPNDFIREAVGHLVASRVTKTPVPTTPSIDRYEPQVADDKPSKRPESLEGSWA